MRTKTLVIFLLAAALSLTACAPAGVPAPTTSASATPQPTVTLETSPTPDVTVTPHVTATRTATLAGTIWILTTLEGQPVLTDTLVTLIFEDGQLGGKDGCNRYGAPYAIEGPQLKLTEALVSTMMACEETIMEQSAAYHATLTEAATYQLSDQQLTLLNAAGQPTASFTRQSAELNGTSWKVISYSTDQETQTEVIAASQLTASFGADGQLTGSAGCNDFGGSYEVTGQSLKISAIVATLKACLEPAGIMEQEQQYLKVLESVTAYQFAGDRLELHGDDETVLVMLEQAD
jgi:heat shock protein HslJ